MNVAQLLYKLRLAPDIEVIIPRLPKRILGAQSEAARDSLFQRLQRLRQRAALQFAGRGQVRVRGSFDCAGLRFACPAPLRMTFLGNGNDALVLCLVACGRGQP